MNDELRAITNSDLKRDSAVMMSSTTPSAKYSCSGSPLRLVNDNTAIEGLSGSGNDLPVSGCDLALVAEDTADRTA